MKPFFKGLAVSIVIALTIIVLLLGLAPAAEPDISISEPKVFFQGEGRVDIVVFIFPLSDAIYRVAADARWANFDSVRTWKRSKGIPRHVVKKIDAGGWGVFQFKMGTAPESPVSYYCGEPRNYPLVRIQVDYSDKDDIPYRKQFAFRGCCVPHDPERALLVWYPIKAKALSREHPLTKAD